ncbi:hypothetical protein [Alkalibacillus haloalkaliphilus]|uniref:hypothetical protein n=1 Tax=Alkalibacillus haloalkaliphilus TaxID=94136 RepID=UPI00030D2609|nr:hypothetical protein [Alkalibacillus haloalkaliphilus]
MKLISKGLILSIALIMLLPILVSADEETQEDQYRLSIEVEWYPVQDDFEHLELPYVSYILDAFFTDDESEREQLNRQIDERIANELYEFFSSDRVIGLTYSEDVLDYLDENFEIDEGGGFFSAIGNFFSGIANFFSGLFS